MNNTILNEECPNFAKVAGVVTSQPTKSHHFEGENFYEFVVEVERLSKIKDHIPVTVSDRIMTDDMICQGDFVQVLGEYRSYNKLENDKSKLILHLFAKDIKKLEENKNFENEVKLSGFVCKEPIYRKTPFEREICDVLLAVNRTNYHKSDYIPCILWGRNARFMGNQSVGCKVELSGRIQSREYTKTNENGESFTKTAYEVSCQKISLLSNVTNLMQNKNNEEKSKIV